MISGIFETGAGTGNQLHEYVMTRVLAFDKGVDFGMIYPENFKGKDFMTLDMGKPVKDLEHEYNEKKVENEYGVDIRGYDWEGIQNIKDNTLVNGYFQGEKYFEHHLERIKEWLKVEPLFIPDDVCVISFRGGEYVGVPDLFLPKSYWDTAIEMIREKYLRIHFEVHTDDPDTAKKFFPDFPCIQNIELNWRSIRYAKHLIVSNSSFSILPSLLGDAKEIIAPKYHAGHNKGYQQLEQNVYDRYTYVV